MLDMRLFDPRNLNRISAYVSNRSNEVNNPYKIVTQSTQASTSNRAASSLSEMQPQPTEAKIQSRIQTGLQSGDVQSNPRTEQPSKNSSVQKKPSRAELSYAEAKKLPSTLDAYNQFQLAIYEETEDGDQLSISANGWDQWNKMKPVDKPDIEDELDVEDETDIEDELDIEDETDIEVEPNVEVDPNVGDELDSISETEANLQNSILNPNTQLN